MYKYKQLQVLVFEGETNQERTPRFGGYRLQRITFIHVYILGLNFKICGKLVETNVMVLIDCGASHNFVSSMLVLEKQLPMTERTPYTRKIKSNGCRQLILQIQWLKIQQVLGKEMVSKFGGD